MCAVRYLTAYSLCLGYAIYMRLIEPSIFEANQSAAIRDAVIGAEPMECHGCPRALEHSYEIGQLARQLMMSAEEAAEAAWGKPEIACCKALVSVERIVEDPAMPDVEAKSLLPV